MTKTDEQKTQTSDNGNLPVVEPPQETDLYLIFGKIIDVVVKVGGLPFFLIGVILDNFIDRKKPGIKVLGAAILMIGVLLSADGWFQLFGGAALFPWFEESWLGWRWFIAIFTFQFWAALIIALAVQWIESNAIRGKSPDEAKKTYESHLEYNLPAKQKNKIDLVNALRWDYKRAGMGERNLLGLGVFLVFLLDFGAIFISRNPLGREPIEVLAVTAYNILVLFAGETGFALWRRAKSN